MEIVFNYLGRMQQLERDDSLFQPDEVLRTDAMSAGDVGPGTRRFGLIDISATATQNQLQFSFYYNRHMRHGQKIRHWISECKKTLEETVMCLRRCPSEPTLSDYPLLPIDYKGIETLVNETFPSVGISQRDEVEDIYPCSPTQEGILLSQFRDSNTYFCNAIFEVRHADPGLHVDTQRLSEAWQKVVNRHAALRTVFIDSTYTGGTFDQMVVKRVDSGIIHLQCDESKARDNLDSIMLQMTNAKRKLPLPHQLTVCATPTGRVLVKMEINHAVIDGASMPLLQRDLAAAYEGRLPEGNGPLYSDYIRYMRSRSIEMDIAFWKKYLEGLQPCHFPHLQKKQSGKRRLGSVLMEFERFPELQSLCESKSITLANVINASWALVLRRYTGSDDVCFGYLSAGRDAPVDGIQDAVGVFINMLCCRVEFSASQSLDEVLQKLKDDYLASIPHQSCSLAQVQHELALPGEMLFNTALSAQNHSPFTSSDQQGLIFEMEAAHDPSEVSEL